MIEFTDSDYQDVCRSPEVGSQIASLMTRRSEALRKFWLYLAGSLILAVAAVWSLTNAGWIMVGWIVGVLLLVVGGIVAYQPIAKTSESIKLPTLEALAARAGMEYFANGFTPPVYSEARKALFGSWLSSETFSDLFNGKDEQGRGYAVYEACLQRRQGKNTHTVFSGQVYALERNGGHGDAVTVVVPDRGIFNFFKPAGGLQRVKMESDAEFDKKFETYSTHPIEARQLLFDSTLRHALLDASKGGRVFTYVGPSAALVAVTGKNRFEPGSLFRSRSGEDRVRMMFDDVCASFKLLRDLKRGLA